jgi:hypothetical protein
VANLYGVANPVIQPAGFGTLAGADVNCPTGVETVIATSVALQAISAGIYYPAILGQVMFQVGAGALTQFSVGVRIGAGADFYNLFYVAAGLPANSWWMMPVIAFGPASTVPWQGAGSTLSVTLLPVGINVAAHVAGTSLWATLYRAPDQ